MIIGAKGALCHISDVALGDLVVSVLAVGPSVPGSNPAEGDDNSQRAFHGKGSKAFGPMS
jgi:hypothetical protein